MTLLCDISSRQGNAPVKSSINRWLNWYKIAQAKLYHTIQDKLTEEEQAIQKRQNAKNFSR